jgi:hypothetical protein
MICGQSADKLKMISSSVAIALAWRYPEQLSPVEYLYLNGLQNNRTRGFAGDFRPVSLRFR